MENDEVFYIDLSSPSNATLSGGVSTLSGAITIVNDDTSAPVDPNAGVIQTLSSSGSLTGTSLNDTLTGSSGADTINGSLGNDIITGKAGSDQLSGGGGVNRFVYSTFSDSTVSAFDYITDLAPAQGDRIAINNLPSKLWYAGSISGNTLQDALTSVYADVDRVSSTDAIRPLGSGDAVIFKYGTGFGIKTYLSVDDPNSSQDLLIRIAGVSLSSLGQLDPSQYFATI